MAAVKHHNKFTIRDQQKGKKERINSNLEGRNGANKNRLFSKINAKKTNIANHTFLVLIRTQIEVYKNRLEM